MWGSLKTGREMAKESGKHRMEMEITIKVHMKKTLKMVTEFTIGQMDPVIQEILKMILNTAKERSLMKMGKWRILYGTREMLRKKYK